MSYKILIRNGIIFEPDFKFKIGNLAVENGFITQNLNAPDEIINAENLYIIPGLCDIHFHGCAGHDFCEGSEEAFNAILNYEKSNGILTICPATMTLPENELIKIVSSAKKFHEKNSDLAGINLEGPFISRNKKGAQNEKFILNPDIKIFKNIFDASGNLIKFVDIAPELNGAFEFINHAKKFATVSLAHTEADYKISDEAFKAGAKHVTHLYNAMPPINHREPGLIIAASENENKNITVELICDGVHVHPAMIRNTFKMFNDDQIIFISDSLEATGMPDGKYKLGGQEIIKSGRVATLSDKKTIAGSVSNLFECFKYSVQVAKIPLETAVKCSTFNPVKSIGLEKSCGTLEAGKLAKILFLNKNLELMKIIDEKIYKF